LEKLKPYKSAESIHIINYGNITTKLNSLSIKWRGVTSPGKKEEKKWKNYRMKSNCSMRGWWQRC
jgi:hypothetical protein